MALIPGQMPYVCRGNLKFRIDRCMNFTWKQVKNYALDRYPLKMAIANRNEIYG